MVQYGKHEDFDGDDEILQTGSGNGLIGVIPERRYEADDAGNGNGDALPPENKDDELDDAELVQR